MGSFVSGDLPMAGMTPMSQGLLPPGHGHLPVVVAVFAAMPLMR